MYARNNFLRLLSLMAAMGILEAVLYVLHWNRVDREQPPLPAAEDLLRGIPLMSMAALLLLLFLLCRSGGEAPAIAYTLRRLRIPEETTVLWKAVYNGLCLLLFWAVQTVLAVLFAQWVIGPMVFAKYWAASFCLLGHMFPVMFGFKGGKGILSGGTIALMLKWKLALLVWGSFLFAAAVTRYVSLGSVLAAAAFPVGTWLFVSHDPVIMAFAAFLGILVIWMHRGNIKRLLKGEENRLSFHKKKP